MLMTLHIGIIGTGWFSRVHADIIKGMNGVKLQAVCGTSLSKAEHMAQDYEAKGYGHLKDMLDSERLDAVYICVPPMSHGEIELELIRRGIPFLVEKPLGLDAELPRRILEQVEATGILTSVGYHFRYAQTVDRLKAMVNTHKVGMALGKWMGSMPVLLGGDSKMVQVGNVLNRRHMSLICFVMSLEKSMRCMRCMVSG